MRPGQGGCLLVTAHCIALGGAVGGLSWLLGAGIAPGVVVAVAAYAVSMVALIGWMIADGIAAGGKDGE